MIYLYFKPYFCHLIRLQNQKMSVCKYVSAHMCDSIKNWNLTFLFYALSLLQISQVNFIGLKPKESVHHLYRWVAYWILYWKCLTLLCTVYMCCHFFICFYKTNLNQPFSSLTVWPWKHLLTTTLKKHVQETAYKGLTDSQWDVFTNLIGYWQSRSVSVIVLKRSGYCSRNRARIFKRLRSPGIDSKKSIPPAYEACRAGTSNRVVVPARQAGNRFLGSGKKRVMYYSNSKTVQNTL